MKKFMLLTLSGVTLALVSQPPVAQAQVSEALSLTAQAVKELTDYPGKGGRTNVDINARGGADIGQIAKAANLYKDALDKAKSGNADGRTVMKLEEALAYAKAREHKEARLMGEGALYQLCKQNNGDPKETCDKVPKFGSYAAP